MGADRCCRNAPDRQYKEVEFSKEVECSKKRYKLPLHRVMGAKVIIRKCVIALSIAALLAGSVNQSKAAPVSPTPVLASSSIGAGVFIVGGFIGVVAALCVYDIILKINGAKNWDGTPKASNRIGGATPGGGRLGTTTR